MAVKRRALLVDDEPAVLFTLAAVLKEHGMAVNTASSGVAAQRALKGDRFDIVITDMSMETDDAGYRVIQAARQHPGRPVTLIFSAFPTLTNDWQARGADALLIKITPMSELLAVIDGLLNQRKA